MRDWFKRFALSFGSNKYMSESAHCGFGSVLLTCLLAAVFLFFGIFTGKNALFGADYKNASEFKDFLYGAFVDGSEMSLGISVGGGKADVTVGGEHVVINTITDDGDAEKYGAHGYSLIVDHHDMTAAYDDFTVDCVPTSGGESIDYEAYLALSETEKNYYKLEVRYSGRIKEIDENDIAEYEAYLGDLQSAAEELKQLKEKYSSDRAKYGVELYKLYIKKYYPDMQKIAGEDVPTLKKYYYNLINDADGKYMCIFGDMLIAAFDNNLGKSVAFGCIYTSDAKLGGTYSSEKSARAALDGFIDKLYYGNLSTLLFFEILNCMFALLFTELIIVAAMLICRGVCRWKNIGIGSSFSNCVKAVGSFVHVAALVAAVAAILFGFFRGGFADTVFALGAFAVCIGVRLAVFLISEYKKDKKQNSGESGASGSGATEDGKAAI